MKLDIKLFARARDLAGSGTITVQLPESCTIAQLKEAMAEQHPSLRPVLASLLIAVDNQYATAETAIHADAEIACFPPVSGG